MRKRSLIVLLIVFLIILYNSFFIVDERQQVVITQFGEAMGEPKTKPGLYLKIPFIQKANYFPKTLLEWDGDPGQIPTLDKTFIWVDTFARWKIGDPLRFFQTVNNEIAAQSRLDDIIDSAVRNFITSFPLIETVRKSNRKFQELELGADKIKELTPLGEVKVGRQKMLEGIMKQAQQKVREFGIELVDVKIKRLNYIEDVRRSIYQRMIAERKQMAEKFRSEGRGEAQKIEGEMEKELKRITSEAYRKAQEIKGRGDAEATRIYAEAFSVDPQFYSFIKTLETYKEGLRDNTTLVLSTDSEFLGYLKGYKDSSEEE